MLLNLSNEFNPYNDGFMDEIDFELIHFSGGEPHIKLKKDVTNDFIIVTHQLNSSKAFMELLVAIKALYDNGAESVEAVLGYIPGARQDRICVPGEALTAQLYTDLLLNSGLKCISTFDPHSDVMPAYLNQHVNIISNHNLFMDV